ncbi:hypothetical protein CEXT_517301 [Caerostris extrusa]|uniref:Uncharacterized protein n=1 Tax=Caerostris extrusa TaxID=172846 RepID=A0AAV4UVI0_CAEEX|nr:hypothetical protein CEXT_517301 [Caerostris extrusa]
MATLSKNDAADGIISIFMTSRLARVLLSGIKSPDKHLPEKEMCFIWLQLGSRNVIWCKMELAIINQATEARVCRAKNFAIFDVSVESSNVGTFFKEKK